MNYSAAVTKPAVNMREEPTVHSRVASQALFSESITIQDQKNNWVLIQTSDGYRGWVQANEVIQLDRPYITTESRVKVTRLKAHVYDVQDTEYGPIISLPYGSVLKVVDDSHARWIEVILPTGNIGYIQKGDVELEKELTHKSELIDFSMKFLDLPYTWGGRSSFGYDCSGFVQMLYSKIGVHLQRDSSQQIHDPRLKTADFEDLEPGDLVFFGTTPQKIGHVGMYSGNGLFIHTTARENKPYLRISSLKDPEWCATPDVWYSYRIGKHLISF